jgi:hypothetical protein
VGPPGGVDRRRARRGRARPARRLLQHRSRAAIGRGQHDAGARGPRAALGSRRGGSARGTRRSRRSTSSSARSLRLAGRDDEALAHAERAIAVAEATLGPEHPSTARRILGRAQVHERRGDLAAALRDDLSALAVWERAYGEHPRLIWPLTCAGRVLRKAR